MRQFVLRVKPVLGQSADDRVLPLAHGDYEFVMRSVTGAGSLTAWHANQVPRVVDEELVAVIGTARSQPDDFGIFRPVAKCIVRVMDRDKTSATPHVLDEMTAYGCGP